MAVNQLNHGKTSLTQSYSLHMEVISSEQRSSYHLISKYISKGSNVIFRLLNKICETVREEALLAKGDKVRWVLKLGKSCYFTSIYSFCMLDRT